MPERRSREKRRKNGRKGGLLLLMGARGAHGEDRRGERHPFNFHLGTGNFRRERKRRRRARGGRREDTARLKEHHSVLHPISFSPNPASTPSTEVARPFFTRGGILVCFLFYRAGKDPMVVRILGKDTLNILRHAHLQPFVFLTTRCQMKFSFLGVLPPDPLPSPASKGYLPWREVMHLKSFSRRNSLRTTSILFRVAQLDIGGRTDRGTSLQILPPQSLPLPGRDGKQRYAGAKTWNLSFYGY